MFARTEKSLMLTMTSPCPICGSSNILPILELPPLTIDTCRMWSTRARAFSAQSTASFDLLWQLQSCV